MHRKRTRPAARLVAATFAATAAAAFGSLVWAGLIPGGGSQPSDCYVELDVQGVDAPGAQVRSNRIVLCTDGDACDTDGACGNDSCTLRVAVCIGQTDPNLPACTPPSSLRRLKANSRLQGALPPALAGSACGSFVDLPIAVRVKRNGRKQPGMLALSANATAEKGTTPARDRDKFVLQCLPSTACAGATSPTTTTTLPAGSMAMVTVGPGGDLRFEPETVRIRPGDTVRWRWASGGHNLVSGSDGIPDGQFCSPQDRRCATAALSGPGATYEHTFPDAGTFPYFCSPHASFGMRGRVIVEP